MNGPYYLDAVRELTEVVVSSMAPAMARHENNNRCYTETRSGTGRDPMQSIVSSAAKDSDNMRRFLALLRMTELKPSDLAGCYAQPGGTLCQTRQ